MSLRDQVPKFRDHWTAKSGKDATKHDWPATFRNWIREADERQKRGQRGGQVPVAGDEPRPRKRLTAADAR